MELRDILLEWLHRVLNPKLERKLVWGLFALGSTLVAFPVIGHFASFTVSTEEVTLDVLIGEKAFDYVAIGFSVVGVSFIGASIYLLLKLNINSHPPKSKDDEGKRKSIIFVDPYDKEIAEIYLKGAEIVHLQYANPEYPYMDKHITIPGGDPNNPMWAEYVDSFPRAVQPYIYQIRKHTEENRLLEKSGKDMNNVIYEFIDGVTISFSWRAWGDFIQAIHNKREGYCKYDM